MKMTFGEKLDNYSETVGFSFKDLSAVSGVSVGTLSNYRSGKQTPKLGNPKLSQIAEGIVAIAKEKGLPLSYTDIFEEFNRCVGGGMIVSYDDFTRNLNTLMRSLDITNVELARHLNYDPSQLSRYLSGKSVPGDVASFATQTASYISSTYSVPDILPTLQRLLGCEEKDIDSPKKLYKMIVKWFGSAAAEAPRNPIDRFLDKLDEFDLNDYIRAIRFDEIPVANIPFDLPTTKYYHGIEEFKKCELDFMRAAALSKSKADLIIYSDMPLSEMAKDEKFAKHYLFGFAVLLKKGLHINFIHDVHRTFEEMLLGLEGNIPMYMTGQLSPYYFVEPQSRVFSHLLKVSGTAAMCGTAVTQDHNDGLYLLTKNKNEVRAYRNAANTMLKSAKPLMDIYRSDRKAEFAEHLHTLWKAGSRRMIFTSLPVFTASEELLLKILHRSDISAESIDEIMSFCGEYRAAMTELLEKYSISIEIGSLSKEMFDKNTPSLALSELFYDNNISYNYEEYTEHLQQTFDFANSFDNCIVKVENEPTFRNISFSIIDDKCVVVSKANDPAIHFVIHHPKMIRAFESFVPPMKE